MTTVNVLANLYDDTPPIRWGALEFEKIDCGVYSLVGKHSPEAEAPLWFSWTVEIEVVDPLKWIAAFGESGSSDHHYLPEPLDLVSALDWAFGETFVRNRFAYSLLTNGESRDEEVPHDEDPVETELGTFIIRESDSFPIRITGEPHLKTIDLPGMWTWTLQLTPDLVFVCLFHEEVLVAHFYEGAISATVNKALEWIRLGVQRGVEARTLQGFLMKGSAKGKTWYDRIS